MTDPGRRRRLLRMAGPSGIVAGLAVDHRDSFSAAMEKRGLAPTGAAEVAAIKTDLVALLAPAATLLILDDESGHAALIEGLVPPFVALAMPLEAQGYEEIALGRTTRLPDDFTPARAAWYGADACKLLLPYRPDHTEAARRQEEVVATALAACHAIGLPLILEPIVYRTAADADFSRAFADLVVSTARRLAALEPDLMKVQFPTAFDADDRERAPDAASGPCRALDEACGSVPWVLLGGGSDSHVLEEQIRIAGRYGASGFIVGRTVWEAALLVDGEERRRAIGSTCALILGRLRQVAEASCRPLRDRPMAPETAAASSIPG